MKSLCLGLGFLLLGLSVRTNENVSYTLNAANKLVIITLDGFRWQEVFTGADSAIIYNPVYNLTGPNTRALYWASTKEERRQKLMPFLWNVIAKQGQLFGNRKYSNNMNVANPYALSYPGYNELLTGSVDLTIFNNGKALNHNTSILEKLNATGIYKDKVAAFASWDAFPYILNKEASTLFINSGFESVSGQNISAAEESINSIMSEIEDKKNVRYDELTYIACKEYIQRKKPSVVFLGFGGTDEAAHQKKYDQYLQQANNADRMIGELWNYFQTLPEYAGKTTFLITTDHGRGNNLDWHTHGMTVSGSSQTWMALLGNGIAAEGEEKHSMQLYQKNLKELMLKLLSQSTNDNQALKL